MSDPIYMKNVCHIHMKNKCTYNFIVIILIVQITGEQHKRAIKFLIKPFLPHSI